MNMLNQIALARDDVQDLRLWLDRQENVISFFEDIQKSSLIVCLTIQLEIGGINDNLAQYLVEGNSGNKVERGDLHSSLCNYNGMSGVTVTHKNEIDMKINLHGFNEFTRIIPGGFVILPELAANYLLRENLEPVLVRSWLMHSTFSTFNPRTDLYQDQVWSLVENDALIYSELISRSQIVLQGIHDMADHAANANFAGWVKAVPVASEMYKKLSNYFQPYQRGNIPSHLVSLAAGAILDELVQVPHYGSIGRIAAVMALLAKLDKTEIDPRTVLALKDFPVSIDHVIAVAAEVNTQEDFPEIYAAVDRYYEDILNLTYKPAHVMQ